MRNRSSLETDLTILMILAVEKECGQYYLPKRIEKDYRTVLRHIPSLEEKGLIILDRTEPATKYGKDRKIYRLTLLGLVEFLRQFEFSSLFNQVVEGIGENCGSLLPLILGKWTLFKNSGMKATILRRLWLAIQEQQNMLFPRLGRNFEHDLKEFLTDLHTDPETGKTDVKKLELELGQAKKGHTMIREGFEKELSDKIARNVLLRFEMSEMEEQLRLFPILKRDSELKNFVDSELSKRNMILKLWIEAWTKS